MKPRSRPSDGRVSTALLSRRPAGLLHPHPPGRLPPVREEVERGRRAFPGTLSAGRVPVPQTLLEKGRFLLLAPRPFVCPKFRVYFYSLNEETELCALSGSAPLPHWGPQSSVNAVGRNVFIEGADFIPQRAVLSDFKHGIGLAYGESAERKSFPFGHRRVSSAHLLSL